jgi:hypothetical protein
MGTFNGRFRALFPHQQPCLDLLSCLRLIFSQGVCDWRRASPWLETAEEKRRLRIEVAFSPPFVTPHAA